MNDLLYLISRSKFTTIGYTSKFEPIRDSIISNFNCIKIDPNNPDNIKSIIRDIKLESIVNDNNIGYFLLDLNDVRYNSEVTGASRRQVFQTIIGDLKIFLSVSKLSYNIIITGPFHSKVNELIGYTSDLVGYTDLSPIHISDLAIGINDYKKIKIIKNKHSDIREIEYDSMDIITKYYSKFYAKNFRHPMGCSK